ncbi:response regulator [Candidatus Pacearchaeota archaeon]|nr:response regulator [Candidatus Pacearchaeota archaeon]
MGIEEKVEKKRILIADDERNINRLVQIHLEKEGYETKSVYNGEDAWQEIENSINSGRTYDMAIIDIMMPKLDGYGLLEKIRNNPDQRIRTLRAIMLTAKTQDKDIYDGWQKGCDMYITKPFNPKELMNFVNRFIEEERDSKS